MTQNKSILKFCPNVETWRDIKTWREPDKTHFPFTTSTLKELTLREPMFNRAFSDGSKQLASFSCGGQRGAQCFAKPCCDSSEEASQKLSQKRSRLSFNYGSPPFESSQCHTVSLIMKTNTPYKALICQLKLLVSRGKSLCIWGWWGMYVRVCGRAYIPSAAAPHFTSFPAS